MAAHSVFFFFNDTATTEIYTLSYTTLFRSPNEQRSPQSIHSRVLTKTRSRGRWCVRALGPVALGNPDRKSTRLNSSHGYISYAVFCLKKKTTAYRCCC